MSHCAPEPITEGVPQPFQTAPGGVYTSIVLKKNTPWRSSDLLIDKLGDDLVFRSERKVFCPSLELPLILETKSPALITRVGSGLRIDCSCVSGMRVFCACNNRNMHVVDTALTHPSEAGVGLATGTTSSSLASHVTTRPTSACDERFSLTSKEISSSTTRDTVDLPNRANPDHLPRNPARTEATTRWTTYTTSMSSRRGHRMGQSVLIKLPGSVTSLARRSSPRRSPVARMRPPSTSTTRMTMPT